MRFLLLLFVLLIGLTTFSQTLQVEQLKVLLQDANLEDTSIVSYNQQIANAVIQVAPDSGLKYAMNGLQLAKKLNALKDQMIFYKIISIGEATKGDYTTAKETINKGISIYKNADQIQALGDLYHNLGIINYRLQDSENSIAAYYKSLEISSALQNNTAYVKTKVSMLSLYVDIKKFDKALQLGNELVDYVKEKMPNDKVVLGKAYQNIGYAYWRSGNLDSAMINIQKAYSIHKPINYYDGLINELGTFAQYYTIKNQYAKSIKYLNESLTYSNKIGHAETQCRTSILLSDNYTKLNDLKNAKIYADSGVAIADRLQLKNLQKSAYDNLAKLSIAQTDYEKAYKLKVISDSIQTKILTNQNIKEAQELDTKYEVKEKDQTIKEQKTALKTHTNLNFLLVAIGIISLGIGYWIYKYLKKEEKKAKQAAQQLAQQLNYAYKQLDIIQNKLVDIKTDTEITVKEENNRIDQVFLIINEKVKIPYTNIYYIEVSSNDLKIFGEKLKPEIEKVRFTLKEVQKLLPNYFTKVQRSFILNTNYLEKIIKKTGKQWIVLSNGKEIPLTENIEEIAAQIALKTPHSITQNTDSITETIDKQP